VFVPVVITLSLEEYSLVSAWNGKKFLKCILHINDCFLLAGVSCKCNHNVQCSHIANILSTNTKSLILWLLTSLSSLLEKNRTANKQYPKVIERTEHFNPRSVTHCSCITQSASALAKRQFEVHWQNENESCWQWEHILSSQKVGNWQILKCCFQV